MGLLDRKHASDAVLVVGLGRFGTAVASSLTRQGRQILAVDIDPATVQRYADEFTHVVVADMTLEEVSDQLGIADFREAVVAIGTDVEASVLTAMALVNMGIPEIWAKAITKRHGEILERIGVNHVLYPEQSMGEQVAHMIVGAMKNYIEFDDDFAIARIRVPQQIIGKQFTQAEVRQNWGITVVGIKRQGQDFLYARDDTVAEIGDELVISGPTSSVEAFAALPK
ncbi:MAG: potassium channel family protein [Propionibacteriaceae bacterium]